MGLTRNRALAIGTKVRITTHDIDEFNGMRPFHVKRSGTITGHNYVDKRITTYNVTTDEGTEYKLSRDQFATSALTSSIKYTKKQQ